jgi:hypothetical protein
MKAISMQIGSTAIERGLNAGIRPDGVWIRQTERGILSDSHTDRVFSLSGATIERFDEGRSLGRAAVGAVAGAMLTGGLGAVAGAAFGGRKKHSVVLRHDNALVVLEVSTAELQTLMGRGTALGSRAAGEQSLTTKQSSSVTMLTVVLILVVGIFLLALVRR